MSQHQLGVGHVEHVMGMAVSFDIRPPVPPDDALRSVIEWLHHVDATFSTYKDDSEITRFARGEITVDELTADVIDVLQTCMDLTTITDGAFDAFLVPAPNGTLLDPSGYVKGWAIERAASMLQLAGASNFCINAGGDIAVRGSATNDDQPWRVGIRHPSMPQHQATVIDVFGPCSIATSATYERGAHIINPRDGQPTTGIASATVIGPDLGTADAFATAVFVMGEDGLGWIESQPDYEAYLITNDEIAMWTSAFPRRRDCSERSA
jgi:FAD:protein FMN transferase